MRILVLWKQDAVIMRNTILDSAFCFQKYDKENEYFYFNIYGGRFPEDYSWIDETMFDIVIFHYYALSLRYSDKRWGDFLELMSGIWRDYPCRKILMPQDDYTMTERIWDLANGICADTIYTVMRECDYDVLYPKDKIGNIKIKTVLTGYVEESYVNRKPLLQHRDREYDVVYRATKLPYQYGKHGQLKYQLTTYFQEYLKDLGLICDLENTIGNKRALLGDSWLDFLASSRTTIGCLSGSGIADITGEYERKEREYMALHKDATYEEVKSVCFPDAKENLTGVISPRIFESAITKTCQILVGEDFQGVLEPDVDYIVLDNDFANIDEVIMKIRDISYCEQIAENCYKHVIESGEYTYRKFVECILNDIGKIDGIREHSKKLSCFIESMCKKNNDLVMKEILKNM